MTSNATSFSAEGNMSEQRAHAPTGSSQRTNDRMGLEQREGHATGGRHAAAPAVDIFQDANGITVVAYMPGVARDRLDIHLDGDTPAIEGAVDVQTPDGLRALWAEVNLPRWRRTFRLSRELDAAKIEASLKDGVLTLRIPKQAHAQPRRIAVQTG